MIDVEMLVTLGDWERTRAEYADLLSRANFRLTRVIHTANPMSISEAVPTCLSPLSLLVRMRSPECVCMSPTSGRGRRGGDLFTTPKGLSRSAPVILRRGYGR
jgi:hypothetical protein